MKRNDVRKILIIGSGPIVFTGRTCDMIEAAAKATIAAVKSAKRDGKGASLIYYRMGDVLLPFGC